MTRKDYGRVFLFTWLLVGLISVIRTPNSLFLGLLSQVAVIVGVICGLIWLKQTIESKKGGEHKNLKNPELLLNYLEQVYSDLKKKNPGKDEHWLLANTWLKRYGSWKASKQKGPKLTKYIAYTTTFQYSILESPKSIRGLALYLAYKEFGEEIYVDEFSQIMNLIQEIKEKVGFMGKYKQKNPQTFKEIQAEKDESMYGLYGFLKATEHFEKHPEEEQEALKRFEEFEKIDKKNKKINIETVAKLLGSSINIIAYENTRSIIERTKEVRPDTDENKFGHILVEIIYFYINITDRFAFAYLGDPKRHDFLAIFLLEVYQNYLEGYKNTGGKVDEITFYNIFNETQKERQKEYGAYKYPIEKGFGTKEDLVYQFARILAEILEVKGDAFVIDNIGIIVMVSIKKYHEFFEKFMSEMPVAR